jgi:hypothetical protein
MQILRQRRNHYTALFCTALHHQPVLSTSLNPASCSIYMMAGTAPVLLNGQHLHKLSTLRAIDWPSMYPSLVLPGTVAAIEVSPATV